MVEGVSTGYTKKLEIVGVGYQAQLKKANTVALQVGYANQVVLEAPPGVTVTVPDSDPRHDQRRGQAGRRPVRRRRPQGPPARALQGQGHSLRRRNRPPQGRQGVRVEVSQESHSLIFRDYFRAGPPVGNRRPLNPAEGSSREQQEPATDRADPPVAAAAPRAEEARRLGGTSAPGGVSQLEAYLRASDQRRNRHDARFGQHASTPK